jgi:hypothetical protein
MSAALIPLLYTWRISTVVRSLINVHMSLDSMIKADDAVKWLCHSAGYRRINFMPDEKCKNAK